MAYCILSHRRPEQLARLVQRIAALSPDALVLVHHDPLGEPLTVDLAPAVLVSARPVVWGGWSLVEATLRLFDEAVARGATWAVLVSGQDYPVRDLGQWEQEVLAHDVSAVLQAEPVPGELLTVPNGDRSLRTSLWWFRLPLLGSQPHGPRADRLIGAVLARTEPRLSYRRLPGAGSFLGLPRRHRPRAEVMWGSGWMALREDAIAAVRRDRDDPEGLHTAFRTSLIADESYVHTVVVAAGLTILNAPVTHTEWTGSLGEAHPQCLDADAVDRALTSGLPFARKFHEAALLDRADAGTS